MKIVVKETDYHGEGEVLIVSDKGELLSSAYYGYEDNFTETILTMLHAIGEAAGFTVHYTDQDRVNTFLALAPIPEYNPDVGINEREDD